MKSFISSILLFMLIYPSALLVSQEALETIAFGSCNDFKRKQDIWDEVAFHEPQLWIWLGDLAYIDSDIPGLIKRGYQKQFDQEQYQRFREAVPITGVWDDHDYGTNNSGKEFPGKETSEEAFLNFMELPEDHPARKREGVYYSETLGPQGQQVKVINLDCRYFRDEPLIDDRPNAKKPYLPNREGTILGEAQWRWLELELANNDAQLTLINTGIQVLPDEHVYEKWANFPLEQERLLKLIESNYNSQIILLTGDRHISEISKTKMANGEFLFEITSSGLTHSYEELEEEANRFRVGRFMNKTGFALLKIDWSGETPKVKAQIIERRKGVFQETILE